MYTHAPPSGGAWTEPNPLRLKTAQPQPRQINPALPTPPTPPTLDDGASSERKKAFPVLSDPPVCPRKSFLGAGRTPVCPPKSFSLADGGPGFCKIACFSIGFDHMGFSGLEKLADGGPVGSRPAPGPAGPCPARPGPTPARPGPDRTGPRARPGPDRPGPAWPGPAPASATSHTDPNVRFDLTTRSQAQIGNAKEEETEEEETTEEEEEEGEEHEGFFHHFQPRAPQTYVPCFRTHYNRNNYPTLYETLNLHANPK